MTKAAAVLASRILDELQGMRIMVFYKEKGIMETLAVSHYFTMEQSEGRRIYAA